MRFDVHAYNNPSKVLYSGKPKYNGVYLKPSYLEFSEISSPSPIEWHVGDYVDYFRTGLRYKLYSVPQPRKRATRDKAGDAFVYSNVQFYADTKELEIAPFRDLVYNDNLISFTTRSSVDTYENVEGIAYRIQANLDDLFPGNWEVVVYPGLDDDTKAEIAEPREFSVDSGSVLDALNQIYEVWKEIGWIHTYDETKGKNILTIGKPNAIASDNISSPFVYGKGKGLTAIKKSIANLADMGTRLYVYGSNRNLLSRYYNSLDIKYADSVDIQNLMLPLGNWGKTDGKPDARKAYLQAPDSIVAQLGIIPKTIYFDGSGENEEIYPSIERVTIGEIRDIKRSLGESDYIPDAQKYPSASERVDEIKVGTSIDEDGRLSDDGKKYQHVLNSTTQSASLSWNYENGVYSKDEILVGQYSFGYPGIVVFHPEGYGYIADPDREIETLSVSITFNGGMTKIDAFSRTSSVRPVYEYIDEIGAEGWRIPLPDLRVTAERSFSSFNVELSISVSLKAGATTKSGQFILVSAPVMIANQVNLSKNATLKLKQIGFDMSSRTALSAGLATISMKDGMCGGREFTVTGCKYNSSDDSWDVVIARTLDDSLNTYFPNSVYPISAGDHFVILDIVMPSLYVESASLKLLEAGQKELESISNPRPFYEPEIDPIVMARSGERITEGMFMQLNDEDLTGGNTEYVLIDNMSITEDETTIPTYRVALRDGKRLTLQQRTNVQIKSSTRVAKDAANVASSASTTVKKANAIAAEPLDVSGVGTTDYLALINKPSINGIQLLGDKSDADLGLFSIRDFQKFFTPHFTEDGTLESIEALAGLWTNSYVSAGGKSDTGGSGSGGALYLLADVLSDGSKVLGAKVGSLLSFDGSHWKAIDQSSITPDLSGFYTKSETDSLLLNKVNTALIGANGGVAPLDAQGHVPEAFLPSYVDDVLEYASKSAFPTTGESGKIYVALDTNLTYRWGGTAYVEISKSLALGHTTDTAFPGNEGLVLQGYFTNGVANDAAKLGGQLPSYYAAASSLSNYLPLTGGAMQGSINMKGHAIHLGSDDDDSLYGADGNVFINASSVNLTCALNGTGATFSNTVKAARFLTSKGLSISDLGPELSSISTQGILDITARALTIRGDGSALLSFSDGFVGVEADEIGFDAPKIHLGSADYFYWDNDKKCLRYTGNLAVDGFVSAGGVSDTSGGGGYDRLDRWADYTGEKATWVLSALLGNELNTRVSTLEARPVVPDGVLTTSNYASTLGSVYLGISATAANSYKLGGLDSWNYLTTTDAYSKFIPNVGGFITSEYDSPFGLKATGGNGAYMWLMEKGGKAGEYGINANGIPTWRDSDSTESTILHSSNWTSFITIPTTLPASDVYAWAKAATKPSYTTSEVTEGTNLYFTEARTKAVKVDNAGYADDAGTLGSLAEGRFFRKNLIHTSADCNTMEANSFTILDRDARDLTCENMPSTSIAGGYGVLTVSHGSYGNQLFFPYGVGGEIYTRSKDYNSSASAPTWESWYRILNSGNYSTYALPITGGDINGNLSVSGNVGIGTSAPNCRFQVLPRTLSDPGAIIKDNATFAVGLSNNDGLWIGMNSSSTSWIQSAYAGTEALPSTSYCYKLSLNPLGGNVGVRTTDPQAALDVNGTTYCNYFTPTLVSESGVYTGLVNASHITGAAAAGDLALWAQNHNIFSWGNFYMLDGSLGIGTINPPSKFSVDGGAIHVRSTSGIAGIYIGANYGGGTSGTYDLIEREGYGNPLYLQYNHPGSIYLCYGGGSVIIGNTYDGFYWDASNNCLHYTGSLAVDGFVSAGGVSDTGGSGGGGLIKTCHTIDEIGWTFNPNDRTDTFNAHAIQSIYNDTRRITTGELSAILATL